MALLVIHLRDGRAVTRHASTLTEAVAKLADVRATTGTDIMRVERPR